MQLFRLWIVAAHVPQKTWPHTTAYTSSKSYSARHSGHSRRTAELDAAAVEVDATGDAVGAVDAGGDGGAGGAGGAGGTGGAAPTVTHKD